MSVSVERRDDQSVALFIDGDLQFDSQDEGIYHESLALPALALAQSRIGGSLSALIIGGGDGLSARELLKSTSIARIDLVDYDPEVLSLAHDDFQDVNQRSLYDERVKTHIEDAWQFVKRASEAGLHYDIIISDLTVAVDTVGSIFHSIAWYEMLRDLLNPGGIIAANSVSPHATPHAYWCIFNTINHTGLHALPYHVSIPSFVRQGYGHDWGFVMASNRVIGWQEVNALVLAEPRLSLKDVAHLTKLFRFPEECVRLQPFAAPAGGEGEIFLHYLFNGDAVEALSGNLWDALATDISAMSYPKPESGWHLIPPEIRTALSDSACGEQPESQILLRVLNLMPALRRFQTKEMIADFVSDPAAFLESIDLERLVELLLQRASELPRQFVDELVLLREQLLEWSGDHQALLNLGMRAMTIVTLVVVIGNLLYPDAVYGKGGGGDHGGGHGGEHGKDGGGGAGRGDHGGDRGAGRDGGRGFDGRGARGFDHGWGGRGWGSRGYGDRWGHWGGWHHAGYWGGWARPWHGWWGGYWGGWGGPYWGGGSGFVNLNFNSSTNNNSNPQSVDEEGNAYPARAYNYQPAVVNNYNYSDNANYDQDGSSSGQTTAEQSNYRLGPDADILSSGQVALHLTDQAYMLVNPKALQVVKQDNGAVIMTLYPDPTLLWHIASEVKRQSSGLQSEAQSKRSAQNWSGSTGFPSQQGEDQGEVQNMQASVDRLNKAEQILGEPADTPPRPDAAPVAGAIEVFASVWMTPDGSYLIVKRPDGTLAYLDGKGWYSDQGKTKLSQPFPSAFKAVAAAYLNNLVKDADGAKNGLLQDQQEANDRMQTLTQDLQEFQSAPAQGGATGAGQSDQTGSADMVQFGSREMPRQEAIRRSQMQIRRVQRRLSSIQNQLSSMPAETAAANKMITSLQ